MHSSLQETGHTLRLALPIIIGHLGQMMLGLTDTLMIGRLGHVELAAAAFSNILIHLVLVLAIGIAASVSVQVSHAHGSDNPAASSEALRHGLFLSLLVGLGAAAAMIASHPLLPRLGQPPEMLAVLPQYLPWIAGSMIWMLPGMVIKSFTEARHHPWPVFWLQIAGVGINIVLNYLWIFGHGGFPAMGLAGAGMATFVARLFTLIGCGLYLFRSRKWSTERPRFAPFHRHEFLALLSLAAPITAQMLMEFGAFAFGALMIGRIGSLPLAAHQIALTCAATSYMIPLGISTAAGIRIGHVLGAGAQLRARRIYWSGQCVTVLIMGGFGLWFYFGGTAIARAFTPDPELIGLTARLLVIAGMFQLFDGTQVMSVGALRAMRDVKIPTLFSLAGYWGIAVPLGLFLGFGRGWGVLGFWTGLATGLGLAALTLTLRAARQLRRVQEQPIEFPQLKHL